MAESYEELQKVFGSYCLKPGTTLPTPTPIFPRYPTPEQKIIEVEMRKKYPDFFTRTRK